MFDNYVLQHKIYIIFTPSAPAMALAMAIISFSHIPVPLPLDIICLN